VTAGNERGRFDATGNLGIGTTTPTAKLFVTGTAGTGDIFAIASSTNARLLTFTSTGRLGLGTTSPTATLAVAGDMSLTGAFRANGNPGTAGMVLQTTGTGTQWVATTSLGFASASSSHDAVSLAGTPNYLTLSGQQITLNQLDLADDLATFTSADLSGRLTDEVGTGAAVFNINPAFGGTATFSGVTATGTIQFSNLTSGLLLANGSGVLSSVATSSLGFRESLFTDGGTTTYLTSLSDSLAIGSTTAHSNAKLDVWGNFRVGTSSTPTLFVDSATGRVGIGTSSPASKLDVWGEGRFVNNYTTDLADLGRALVTDVNIIPGSSFTDNYIAGAVDVDITGSNNLSGSVRGNQVDIRTSNTGTGAFSIYGTETYIENSNTGSVGNVFGSYIQIDNTGGGTMNNVYGVYSGIQNSASTLTGTAYNFYAPELSSVSNNIGLYIGNLGSDAGDYSVYTENTKSYFGGSVGIGTTTPTAKLFVTGTAGTGDIFAIASSTNARLLTFTSTGRLGLGTTSPTATLAVAGDMSLTGAFRANGNPGTAGMVLQTTGTGTQWVATSSLGIGGGSLFTDGGATTYLTSLSDSLAIGSTTAHSNAKLDVWGNFRVGTSSIPTLFVDSATGRVGIGTSTLSSKLHVKGDVYINERYTGSGTQTLVSNLLEFDGSSTGIKTAQYNRVLVDGTDSFTGITRIYGSQNIISYNSSVDSTSTDLYGEYIYIDNAGGAEIRDIYGVSSNVFNSSGFDSNPEVRNIFGFYSTAANYGSAANQTGTSYSFYAAEPSSSGNSVGLYVGYMGTDADDYGIYVDALSPTLSSKSYFGGSVGIGTTSPASKLDVWGSFRVGTSSVPLLLADTSNRTVAIGTTTAASINALLRLENNNQFTSNNTGIYNSLFDTTGNGKGIINRISSSIRTGSYIGLDNEFIHTYTGTNGEAYVTGVRNNLSASSTDADTVLIGVQNDISLSDGFGYGVINNLYGNNAGESGELYGSETTIQSLTNLDVAYGAYIRDRVFGSDNASITGGTAYGVYIDIADPDLTGGHSLYVANGSRDSYFGSNVGIGTTTPTAKLFVTGTAGAQDIFAIASSTNARLLTFTSTGRSRSWYHLTNRYLSGGR
jgi:hypothetical protein